MTGRRASGTQGWSKLKVMLRYSNSLVAMVQQLGAGHSGREPPPPCGPLPLLPPSASFPLQAKPLDRDNPFASKRGRRRGSAGFPGGSFSTVSAPAAYFQEVSRFGYGQPPGAFVPGLLCSSLLSSLAEHGSNS